VSSRESEAIEGSSQVKFLFFGFSNDFFLHKSMCHAHPCSWLNNCAHGQNARERILAPQRTRKNEFHKLEHSNTFSFKPPDCAIAPATVSRMKTNIIPNINDPSLILPYDRGDGQGFQFENPSFSPVIGCLNPELVSGETQRVLSYD
jgi:hypothetical protein